MVLCGLAAIATVAPPARAASASRTLSAGSLIRRLRTHAVVISEPLRITGHFDLQPLGVVKHAFVCRGCYFTDFVAPDVVFSAPVDLSGARIAGRVNLRAAEFQDTALFGAPWIHASEFHGVADFRLTRFEKFAGFEQVRFVRRAEFGLSRFEAGADFAGAQFGGQVGFTAATLIDTTTFEGARFARSATFLRTQFQGDTDFREGMFSRDVTFEDAAFSAGADISQATFTGSATFDRCRFVKGATFLGSRFSGTGPGYSAFSGSFDYVVADAPLSFADATFSKLALFTHVTAPAISFRSVHIHGRGTSMHNLSTSDITLSVDTVSTHINAEDQVALLALIEESAKAHNDLGLANQAHYQLQVDASRHYRFVRRIGDLVFYRWIAGYLVEPLNPLVVLVSLALIMAALRCLYRQTRVDRAASARRHPRRAARHGWRFLSELPDEFLDTLSTVGRGAPAPAAAPAQAKALVTSATSRGTVRRLEVLAYRLLLVCVLLGLANSNPTLRQMFDALR